jgi:hypothetical protein
MVLQVTSGFYDEVPGKPSIMIKSFCLRDRVYLFTDLSAMSVNFSPKNEVIFGNRSMNETQTIGPHGVGWSRVRSRPLLVAGNVL